MTRACAGLVGLLLLVVGLLSGARPAWSHEISMAELELRQLRPGEFQWQWTAGHRAGDALLRPIWPEGCRDDGGRLRCGEDGLRGWLGVQGVGHRHSAVLVKIRWLDGTLRVHTLTASQPSVQVYGTPDDGRGAAEIAQAYVGLGFGHILGGFDHLLFVAGLLFLVGYGRALLWTITAFTVAHSLTLALSALGWIVLRAPPVEAAIALSIVLVAGEALRGEATWSRRWPALVAFVFGLVHGLGFAGALQQIGLPQNHLLAALLAFNVGVEAGQLAVVAVAYGVMRLLAPWPRLAATRVPALYAMGGVAAYWAWARIAAIVA